MMLRGVLTGLRSGLRPDRLLATFRRSNHERNYHQYKPKDKSHLYEVSESIQQNSKDHLLFRYEAPSRIMRFNALAITMFPMWTYLSYFCYNLDNYLAPFRAKMTPEMAEGWVNKTVEKARLGVAAGFFLFGKTKFQR